MIAYATLADVEIEAKASGDDVTKAATIEGKKYLEYYALPQVSARIDAITQATFAPLISTRPYDATTQYRDWYHNQLMLDYPLLEATTVTVAGQALTQWTDGDYSNQFNYDYGVYPRTRTPYTCLQGLQLNTWWPFYYTTTYGWPASYMDAIQVTGIWGYRSNYANEGWIASGDSVQDALGMNASVTSITVNDADGTQYNGLTPRFSPNQMLRIGTEFLAVTAVNANANVLTVVRGIRGSTAASHAKDTNIEIWYPEDTIRRACARWASYHYYKRSVYEAVQINAAGTYAQSIPQDLPDELRGILSQYIWIQSGRV
jgi:hypothetical protein